jgi:hypothetical protein
MAITPMARLPRTKLLCFSITCGRGSMIAMTDELWDTEEKVAAARERFAAAIPGWEYPAAYGFGRLVDGRIEFARVNTTGGKLPALTLATVVGHVSGSGTYPIAVEGLTRAIELAEPAEAWTAIAHENLPVLRRLRTELDPGESLLVVFADGSESSDPHVRALNEAVGR